MGGNSGTIDRCQLLTHLHTVRGSSLSFPRHFPPETSLKRQFYDIQNFLTRFNSDRRSIIYVRITVNLYIRYNSYRYKIVHRLVENV